MGIQRLQPQGGGIDWSKYKPLTRYFDASLAASSTNTIFNITGKGYLDLATLTHAGTGHMRIRVTVDGTVIHFTICNNGTAQIAGFGPTELLNTADGTSVTKVKSILTGNARSTGAILPYPTTNGVIGFVFINKPIFFNTSLLVEVLNDQTSAFAAQVVIIGGIE